MESYLTGTGQKLSVHSAKDCRGTFCPVHNPSLPWPTHWREEGFMEYICPCGIGYPAPEAMDEVVFGSCPNEEHIKMFAEAIAKVMEAE